MIQLDLFQDLDVPIRDDAKIMRELNEVRQIALDTYRSSDRVRKSIFAKHSELSKLYIEIHNRLQILESNICKNK